MERPKVKRKKTSWFSITSVFLLAIALAVGMTTSVHAASGSFDRDGYLPDLGSSDQDRAWITVTDSTGNTTNSADDIDVTIKNVTQNVFSTFKLKETGGTTTVFTTTGAAQAAAYPVGSTSGYVEDFNSGSHNYPALGSSVVGLNLKELSSNSGGNAVTGSDGQLSVASGDTIQLLYSGATLDTAVVKSNSGSFSFSPSAVTAVTSDTLGSANLIISITDQDENLDPVFKDVIGLADRSALLSGTPGTGSSRVQIEAIDQTTGNRLSVGGTEVVARNIMLVETANDSGVFTASGKVFGSTTATIVNGNVLVGSSSTPVYTGQDITLGNLTAGPGVRFKIIEVSASGQLSLYEAGTTTSPAQPVLGFVAPAGGSFVGTSSLSTSNVVVMGTTTCLFGVPSSTANQGTNTSGLLKLIEGNDYCLVAISQFKGTTTGTTIGGAYTIGNGGTVSVTLDSFQISGPRSGDTLKVSYLDELRSNGTSGTVTGSLAYGVAGKTGTLARDSDAPDINAFATITVVDDNLNTSSSSSESVASGSSSWSGTTTNRRGDHLTVSAYNQSAKAIDLKHVDGFEVGAQAIRISNTSNSLVWMVPNTAGIFGNPLTSGSITVSLGTESVSSVPLVRGDSTAANSFLESASTASFVATLDGLDNTVEISPDGTHWISVPIEEEGANTGTFVGTIGFDYTALRLTTSTTTSVTTLISDHTGTTTIKFENPVAAAGRVDSVIGTGSVVRVFDGTTEEFTEVCSPTNTTLSVKKLAKSTAYDPDKTYVQVIGNDMMTQRIETTDGTVIARIGAICGGTYRIRYNDAIGESNAYLGGDTLAITAGNFGFTAYTASLSTDVTGSSGPNTFITVTLVDEDLNTDTSSKQTTFEADSTGSGAAFITANNENGLGLPSGSSTGNVSRGFVNGATAKILYASRLGSLPSSSADQSDNTIDFPLVETANDSGTFKGSFQLSSSASTSNASDILKVSNGENITVFYNDSPSGTKCDNSAAYVTTDPILIVAELGNLSLSKETAYLTGDTVVATVIDEDRNTTNNTADTLTTALKVAGANYDATGTDGDLTMDLVENGVNTGTFLATITTGGTTSGGGVGADFGTIKSQQGGVVNVVYTDTNPSSSSTTKQLAFSSFDATLEFSADTVGLGAYALLTLADAERNANAATTESLLSDVFIQTSSANSTKVRMVESGEDTGVFAGSIKVAASGGTTEFSQIQAAEGDTLTATYSDAVNTTGSVRSVTDTAAVTCGGDVGGTVTDADTGALIEGATVELAQDGTAVASTTTDDQGAYAFQGIAEGDYTVAAQADGYVSSTPAPVTVVCFETATVDIGLTTVPPPCEGVGDIVGVVTDTATSLPIEGATVALATGPTPQDVIGNTQTNALGEYTFPDVDCTNNGESYTVAAQKTGYQPNAIPNVEVVGGETTTVDIALTQIVPPPPPGNIAGVVTDAVTGAPIANATVVLGTLTPPPDAGDIISTTKTNAQGGYAFQAVPVGSYGVAADATGYARSPADNIEAPVTVVSGETTRADFALLPIGATPTPTPTPTPVTCDVAAAIDAPASVALVKGESTEVTVTVTGEDGCAVVGDKVKATSKDTGIATVSPSKVTTDANGQATFTITGTGKGSAKITFKESTADLKAKTTVDVTKP